MCGKKFAKSAVKFGFSNFFKLKFVAFSAEFVRVLCGRCVKFSVW